MSNPGVYAGVVAPRARRSRSRSARVLQAAIDLACAWRQRAIERRELAQLGDREIRDLGLSRGDVLTELHKPFWRA